MTPPVATPSEPSATMRLDATVRLPKDPAPKGTELHIIGVHLYLQNEAGQILLGLRHPDCAFAGNTWHFLAGHCERESATACLIREAEEEAGLRIHAEDTELVHIVHLAGPPGARPRMQFVFRANAWSGRPEPREPDRCLQWEWWDPDNLPTALVPYTRAAITGVRAGRAYTEMDWS